MKILVLGSGGREPAISWALAKSPKCEALFVAPGNGGTATLAKAENVPSLDACDGDAVLAFAQAHDIGLVVIGIAMQESPVWGFRTSYLAMTVGAALMFIRYTEFSQLATDDHMLRQQAALDTDPLTGLSSRYAYSVALKGYDAAGALPEDLAAFTIDINGLKGVNDALGHDAGDELICGAARCIERAFSSGRFYRTGGDEFVVLARDMNRARAGIALNSLYREAGRWRGEKGQKLKLAAGYALAVKHPGLSSEKLVHEADLQMYQAKARYYRKSGTNRRLQKSMMKTAEKRR